MAFDDLDELEQGELVQKWLRENALSIIIGVALGLLLIFGFYKWQAHKVGHNMDAAVQYGVFGADPFAVVTLALIVVLIAVFGFYVLWRWKLGDEVDDKT